MEVIYDISINPATMLAPAHAGHLPTLRALIRNGAADGSFDPELASNSPETSLFFDNLRQALVTGQFVVEDARGVLSCRAVNGYVYWPDDRDPPLQPVGFGLFRAFGEFGYELWLTAVAPDWRGSGHGRALLRSLLATPAGRLAFVVRVQSANTASAAMEHLLLDHGYTPIRETPGTRWFVRGDAPAIVRERIVTAQIAPRITH